MFGLRSAAVLLLAALVTPLATSANRADVGLASSIHQTDRHTASPSGHDVADDHALGLLPDDDSNPLALTGQSRNLRHIGWHFPFLFPRCPRCKFYKCSPSGLFKLGHCRMRVRPRPPVSIRPPTRPRRWKVVLCRMLIRPWFVDTASLTGAPSPTGRLPADSPAAAMPALTDATFDIPSSSRAAGDTEPVRGAACFTDDDCALPAAAFAPLNGSAPLAADGVVTAQCVRMGLDGALSDDEPGICLCLYGYTNTTEPPGPTPEELEEMAASMSVRGGMGVTPPLRPVVDSPPDMDDDSSGAFYDVCVQVSATVRRPGGTGNTRPPVPACPVVRNQTSDVGILMSSDYFTFQNETVYEYDVAELDLESYGYEYVDGDFRGIATQDPDPGPDVTEPEPDVAEAPEVFDVEVSMRLADP